MNIDTNTIVPISVANQNFSKVARLVDQYGSAVIMKNNTPRYIIYGIQPSGHHAGGSRLTDFCFLRPLMQQHAHVC